MPKAGVRRRGASQQSGTLQDLDYRIISRVQQGLGLTLRPYDSVAQDLGLAPDKLLERLRVLRRLRVLNFLGPIYFSEAFGRGLSLATARVPDAFLEKVAREISCFPEVIHLSTSLNRFNVWFTVKAKGLAAKERVLKTIEERIGYRIFHLYSRGEFHYGGTAQPAEEAAAAVLSELDWRLIAATEKGLPIVAEPYAEVATHLGVSPDELLMRFERLSERGILLRNAAVPNYCRLGYKAVGLSLWEVKEENCQRLGQLITRMPCVSQCSLRPQYLPEWPFNLLVVVHGRSRREVRQHAQDVADLLGADCHSRDLLFRARTLKKTKDWPLQGIG